MTERPAFGCTRQGSGGQLERERAEGCGFGYIPPHLVAPREGAVLFVAGGVAARRGAQADALRAPLRLVSRAVVVEIRPVSVVVVALPHHPVGVGGQHRLVVRAVEDRIRSLLVEEEAVVARLDAGDSREPTAVSQVGALRRADLWGGPPSFGSVGAREGDQALYLAAGPTSGATLVRLFAGGGDGGEAVSKHGAHSGVLACAATYAHASSHSDIPAVWACTQLICEPHVPAPLLACVSHTAEQPRCEQKEDSPGGTSVVNRRSTVDRETSRRTPVHIVDD